MPESSLQVETLVKIPSTRGGSVSRRVIGSKRRKIFFPDETVQQREKINVIQHLLRDEPTEYPAPVDPFEGDVRDTLDTRKSPKHAGGRKHRRKNALQLLLSRGFHAVSQTAKEKFPRRSKFAGTFIHEPSDISRVRSEDIQPVDPWAESHGTPLKVDMSSISNQEPPKPSLNWTKRFIVKLTAVLAGLGGAGAYTGATVTHEVLNPGSDSKPASTLEENKVRETIGGAGDQLPSDYSHDQGSQPSSTPSKT